MLSVSKADEIHIYTDGACSGNPGAGGYGAILIYRGHEKEISGYEAHTTNNRMELQAVISALKVVTKDKAVVVYTDSQYVKNGITTWIHSWKVSNWKNGKIKNTDLWQELDALAQKFAIEWRWVKGHSGHPLNDRADELARRAIAELRHKENGTIK